MCPVDKINAENERIRNLCLCIKEKRLSERASCTRDLVEYEKKVTLRQEVGFGRPSSPCDWNNAPVLAYLRALQY